MSARPPDTTPRPTPAPKVSDLLPDGLEPEEMGLLRTSNKAAPLVNDTPTRRARQFLREAKTLKELVSQGVDDEMTRARLPKIIPTLSDLAVNCSTKRVRFQAGKELREWIAIFEGKEEKSKGGNSFNIHGGTVQINVDGSKDGPITSITQVPEAEER